MPPDVSTTFRDWGWLNETWGGRANGRFKVGEPLLGELPMCCTDLVELLDDGLRYALDDDDEGRGPAVDEEEGPGAEVKGALPFAVRKLFQWFGSRLRSSPCSSDRVSVRTLTRRYL